MNWDRRTIPFKILTVLLGVFMSAEAQAQVNINAGNPSGQFNNIVIAEDDILSLRLQVRDADYESEGRISVNGNEIEVLFNGVDSSNDSIVTTFNVNIADSEKGFFNLNGGTNTISFTFIAPDTANPNNDGFEVLTVTPVSELPTKEYAAIEVGTDSEISRARLKALDIYKRLVGVRVPIDHPTIIAMEAKVAAGDLRGAAAEATKEPGFYNLVVRDFAAQMSTRDLSINEPLNDFTATFIGVTRDGIDARKLLYGNFFYKGSIDANVGQDVREDFVRRNRHYQQLADENYDLASVLEQVNTQYILENSGNNGPVIDNPDSAGVLTTRGFMGAHALDGTNRRLVEYTMKNFACFQMEDWADATAPDTRVGQDIDRAPGGEASKFLTTCKACHSVMDGFRGAFAKYDFEPNRGVIYRNGVDGKMTRNAETFPSGFRTRDNSWVNNARGPANAQKFGWRGVAASGNGVRQFGKAVANTRAFSRCMVKRVYRELCRRPVANFEQGMVEQMSSAFEGGGYNLKNLFEEIAIRPECLGVN